jgi:polar amino acid transport system ATP-binding protein
MKPAILCLDEPTSALDPLLTNYVAQSIQDLAKEKYVVLVASHDTALLKQLDCTIYLMEKGVIVETAPSKKFYANEDQFPLIKKFVEG